MDKREIYSWSDFDEDMNKIAAWAKPRNFKSVYGIPRGGLVLAIKLSHILDIPLVLHRGDITPNTLVVDDIVDKGKTLKRFLRSVDINCFVASIFWNSSSPVKPNLFVRKKKRNTKKKKYWIVFPWETEASSRYDGTVL